MPSAGLHRVAVRYGGRLVRPRPEAAKGSPVGLAESRRSTSDEDKEPPWWFPAVVRARNRVAAQRSGGATRCAWFAPVRRTPRRWTEPVRRKRSSRRSSTTCGRASVRSRSRSRARRSVPARAWSNRRWRRPLRLSSRRTSIAAISEAAHGLSSRGSAADGGCELEQVGVASLQGAQGGLHLGGTAGRPAGRRQALGPDAPPQERAEVLVSDGGIGQDSTSSSRRLGCLDSKSPSKARNWPASPRHITRSNLSPTAELVTPS